MQNSQPRSRKNHSLSKRLPLIASAVLLGISTLTHAVDCGPYKVTIVQAQPGDVLVQVSGQGVNVWKSLGLWSSASTKPYMAIVQQAMAMDRSIFLRYTDGYSCTAPDYSTQPQMVRLDLTM